MQSQGSQAAVGQISESRSNTSPERTSAATGDVSQDTEKTTLTTMSSSSTAASQNLASIARFSFSGNELLISATQSVVPVSSFEGLAHKAELGIYGLLLAVLPILL